MKSKWLSCDGGQPWHAQLSRILQREQRGSSQASLTELCTAGDMSPLSTVGPATTTTTTLRLTQQYQTTTMTLSLQRGTRMNLCSHPVSKCPVCSRVRGVVFGRRWLSHAMSRAHKVSGQCPSRQSPPQEQFRGQRGLRATSAWFVGVGE